MDLVNDRQSKSLSIEKRTLNSFVDIPSCHITCIPSRDNSASEILSVSQVSVRAIMFKA